MKIAILGPPGSGKTKLARALAKEFTLKVVDNYAQKLQKDTGLALGPWSDYGENFMVAGVREAAERKVKDNYIVCGTIIDTLTYAMTHSDVMMHQSEEWARAIYLSAEASMKGLSLLYNSFWNYDLAFALRYNDQDQPAWSLALDKAYPQVVEAFEVPFVYGIMGAHEERVEICKEVIKIAREAPKTE